MTTQANFNDLVQEIAQLKNDIVRLKRHNFTLVTLIGNLIDGQKLVSPSIMEASVIYDLMGDELQNIRGMIENYQNLKTFMEQADRMSNPNINADTIMFVVEAFKNNHSTLNKQCTKILKEYQTIISG